MTHYILVLLVLFFGSLSFYLLYERFVRRRKQGESITYGKALVDLLDGRPESAFSKLRQVVSEDPSNVDAYLRLGQILRENGQPERALQIHKDLTLRSGLKPARKVAILRQLTDDYLQLGDVKTAEKAIREIIALDNRNRWAYTTLLETQEKAHQWEEAYETASQILRLEANKSRRPLARYKCEIGRRLFNQREYHKCRLVAKEALGLDPGCVDAFLVIGDSYAAEQRFEDAVNFWQKLIVSVPEKGHRVIDRLKKTLFDLGRFGEIVRICEDILRYDPRNHEAQLTLAEINEKKGDLKAAAAILENMVEQEPHARGPLMSLARLYLEMGDSQKAIKLLRSYEKESGPASVKGVASKTSGSQPVST